MTLILANVRFTSAEQTASVRGLPALLIILAVLALLIIGAVAVVRFLARKARR